MLEWKTHVHLCEHAKMMLLTMCDEVVLVHHCIHYCFYLLTSYIIVILVVGMYDGDDDDEIIILMIVHWECYLNSLFDGADHNDDDLLSGGAGLLLLFIASQHISLMLICFYVDFLIVALCSMVLRLFVNRSVFFGFITY